MNILLLYQHNGSFKDLLGPVRKAHPDLVDIGPGCHNPSRDTSIPAKSRVVRSHSMYLEYTAAGNPWIGGETRVEC